MFVFLFYFLFRVLVQYRQDNNHLDSNSISVHSRLSSWTRGGSRRRRALGMATAGRLTASQVWREQSPATPGASAKAPAAVPVGLRGAGGGMHNNNGCGLFMTPVEFPATSTIDPFLATTRTILRVENYYRFRSCYNISDPIEKTQPLCPRLNMSLEFL